MEGGNIQRNGKEMKQSKRWNIGDKVILSQQGKETFPRLKCQVGVVPSISTLEIANDYLRVRRGPMKKAELRHVDFWEKEKNQW